MSEFDVAFVYIAVFPSQLFKVFDEVLAFFADGDAAVSQHVVDGVDPIFDWRVF